MPEIIGDIAWEFVLNLENTDTNYIGIAEKFCMDRESWRMWIKSKEAMEVDFPSGYEEKLTLFQKMLLNKGLRPEKISVLIHNFV